MSRAQGKPLPMSTSLIKIIPHRHVPKITKSKLLSNKKVCLLVIPEPTQLTINLRHHTDCGGLWEWPSCFNAQSTAWRNYLERTRRCGLCGGGMSPRGGSCICCELSVLAPAPCLPDHCHALYNDAHEARLQCNAFLPKLSW